MPIYKNPNFKQAFDKYREWFAKGYNNPKVFARVYDEWANDLLNGNVVMCVNNRGFGSNEPVLSFIKAHPDLDGKIVPITSGAKKYTVNGRTDEVIYLTKMNKNPDKFIQFMNWMCKSKENYMLAEYGVEGLTYILNKNSDGTTSMDIPAAKKTDTITTPFNLKGDELHDIKIYDYEKDFIPAGANQIYLNSMKLLEGLNEQNTFLNPTVGLGSKRIQNRQGSMERCAKYIAVEFEKLSLDTKIADPVKKYEEIYNKYLQMGGQKILDMYNEALKNSK